MAAQAFVVVVVYVVEMAPQAKEALLEFRLVVVAKVGKEALKHLALLIGKIRYVVKLVYVFKIAEYLVGISHILVDVVEVGNEQLSPTVEVVEGLVYARTLDERLVQIAYKLDGVAHRSCRVLAKEVADGDVGRAPYRFAGVACQVLVHKEGGTLVGEYHRNAREVGTPLVYDVFGDKLQKSLDVAHC